VKYGGVLADQARGLKELEKGRFKRLVANLTLNNAILKEVLRETSEPVTEAEGGDVGLRKPSDFRTATSDLASKHWV